MLIILAAIFTGCAVTSKGNKFNGSVIDNMVLEGTSVEEVKKLLGEPDRVRIKTHNDKEFKILRYRYGEIINNKAHNKALHVEFFEEKVNAYNFRSDFSEDNTNFDETNRNKLTISVTTKSDVLDLFGKPTGKMKVPSTFSKGFYRSEGEKLAEGAEEIWSYLYLYKDRTVSPPAKNMKYLVLYFDDNDKLSNKLYVHEH